VLLRAGLLQPVVPALVVVAAVSRRALMGL
jgi:hypothetical protein